MIHSLTGRVIALIVGSTAIAVSALAVCVVWIFEHSLDSQLNNHLAAYNDLLVTAVHVQDGTVVVESDNQLLQSIPRYWQIDLPDGGIVKSIQLEGQFPQHPYPDVRQFVYHDAGQGIIAYQQYFDFPDNNRVRITFGIKEETANQYKVGLRKQFSRYVYMALAGVSVLLIAMGYVIVVLITRPLRTASSALRQVQDGAIDRIRGNYPKEIDDLTSQVNQLLDYANTTIQRHRTFSANVAHALKTPLTVIRNETDSSLIRDRIDAMLQIIDRNLARVQVAADHYHLSARIQALRIIQKIADGFSRVYERTIDIRCETGIYYRIDEADLYEMVGNLVENACKFGQSRVLLTADTGQIIVEDDGPGIAETDCDTVLARGIRLDQTKPGSGIGLAVTADMVDLYGGTLKLAKSDALGGLKASLLFSSSQ